MRFPKLAIKSQSQSGNSEYLHKQLSDMAGEEGLFALRSDYE